MMKFFRKTEYNRPAISSRRGEDWDINSTLSLRSVSHSRILEDNIFMYLLNKVNKEILNYTGSVQRFALGQNKSGHKFEIVTSFLFSFKNIRG